MYERTKIVFVLGYEDEEDKVSEDDGKTFADISDWTERASKS